MFNWLVFSLPALHHKPDWCLPCLRHHLGGPYRCLDSTKNGHRVVWYTRLGGAGEGRQRQQLHISQTRTDQSYYVQRRYITRLAHAFGCTDWADWGSGMSASGTAGQVTVSVEMDDHSLLISGHVSSQQQPNSKCLHVHLLWSTAVNNGTRQEWEPRNHNDKWPRHIFYCIF